MHTAAAEPSRQHLVKFCLSICSGCPRRICAHTKRLCRRLSGTMTGTQSCCASAIHETQVRYSGSPGSTRACLAGLGVRRRPAFHHTTSHSCLSASIGHRQSLLSDACGKGIWDAPRAHSSRRRFDGPSLTTFAHETPAHTAASHRNPQQIRQAFEHAFHTLTSTFAKRQAPKPLGWSDCSLLGRLFTIDEETLGYR